MPSLQVLIVGSSGFLSLLAGILGVLLTCSPSSEGCGSSNAGAGFGVSIILSLISVLASVLFTSKMSSGVADVVGKMNRMIELDTGLLTAMDEDDQPPPPAFVSELTDLEQAQFELQRVVADIATFLPHSLFRRKDDGLKKVDPDAVSARKGPMDLQSQNTIGKASTHMSSNSTSLTAARILQLSSNLMHRRITVLCINIRAFRHSFSEGSIVDDVLECLAEYIHEVEDIVATHHGCIDHFHGDHVMVSFNAFHHVSQHTRKAVGTALDVIDRLKGWDEEEEELNGGPLQHLDVSCGVSTGNAFVGNIGSHHTRRPCIIGTVFTQASVLQRLTKLYFPCPKHQPAASSPNNGAATPNYLSGAASGAASASGSYNATYLSPQGPSSTNNGRSGTTDADVQSLFTPAHQVLVQYHVATDCDHDYACQALDIVNLPGMTRRNCIFAVHPLPQFEAFQRALEKTQRKAKRHSTIAHEEWMYQVEQQQQANPFLNLNCAFDELLGGNHVEAKEFLEAHRQQMADLEENSEDALSGVSDLTRISERNLATAMHAIDMKIAAQNNGDGNSAATNNADATVAGAAPSSQHSNVQVSANGELLFERDLGMYYNWSVK